MNWIQKLFLAFVTVGGVAVLWAELFRWNTRWDSIGMASYLCYLAIAIAAAKLKCRMPGIATPSVFLIFVFLGILDWNLPATLFLACTATLLRSLWEPSVSLVGVSQSGVSQFNNVSKAQDILLHVATTAIATAASYYVYRSDALRTTGVEGPVLLAGASILFFAMNTFPAAAAVALRNRKSVRLFWKNHYFWSLPFYLIYACIATFVSFIGKRVGWQTGLFVVPLIYLAQRYYSLYLGRLEDQKNHAEEVAALHLRTIEALALAIEAKDLTAPDHLRRVPLFATAIGQEMGLSKSELDALQAAAVLHDIGKLAVPEHIVSKPGKLTREEFDKMKIHPIVGAEILERVRFPYPVTPIVRSHHENWNGSGYPDGLRGDEIPVGARILAAVDRLDALASERQYRRALPLEEALLRVVAESGVSFDPRVVEILQRRCAELETLVKSQYPKNLKPAARHAVERVIESTARLDSPGPAGAIPIAQPPGDFLSHIAAARQEVQDLFELAQDLGSSLSLNETLSLLAIRLKRIIPYDALAIYVPRDNVLKPEYVSGENFRLFSTLEIPLGQGLSGWVAENRKSILNGNPAAESGYLADETKFTSMRSALSVPLTGLSGVVSVLTLYHADREAFTRDHLRILMAIATKVGHSIENALKYEQAESSASTDYMTGLPNARSLFLHLDGELARSRRLAAPVVVLVCDLNGFKGVNDRFGHLEGNRLLRVLAGKIKECCREYDYVARMGGDEFVLVLPALRMDQAKSTMQRLNSAAQDSGQEVCGIETLSLSIGAAVYPDDGTEADQLLSEADRRMYLAKQKQKMRVVEPRGFDFDQMMAV